MNGGNQAQKSIHGPLAFGRPVLKKYLVFDTFSRSKPLILFPVEKKKGGKYEPDLFLVFSFY
jgi:hypothetical protein